MKTSCTCNACTRCCKFLPGALTLMDDLLPIEKLTRGAEEDEEVWAKRMFVASAGAVLGDRETGERIEVPTLALKSDRKGHCVHLKGNRCSIYAARPSACSMFDSCCQTDADAQQIGLSMHLQRLDGFRHGSARYVRLWHMLNDAGQTRSRAALNKRIKKLNRR